MSWHAVAALTCLGLVVLCWGICAYGQRLKNPVIKDRYRGAFTVGKDVK